MVDVSDIVTYRVVVSELLEEPNYQVAEALKDRLNEDGKR